MKLEITEKDINRIVGRFIIQLDTDDPIFLDKQSKNLEFYLVKRIMFILLTDRGISYTNLFGNVFSYSTKEEFVDWFNNYLGESKGKRFHRLLTSAELDIVFDFIKNKNY